MYVVRNRWRVSFLHSYVFLLPILVNREGSLPLNVLCRNWKNSCNFPNRTGFEEGLTRDWGLETGGITPLLDVSSVSAFSIIQLLSIKLQVHIIMLNLNMHSGSFGTQSGERFSYISESQPALFRLVEAQKWNKLRKIMRKNEKSIWEKDGSGLSLLGMALGFDAPIDIIKLILDMDRSQASATDLFGATPLHIACLNGASPETISYLLQSQVGIAQLHDRDRRIPLHHMVECLCRDEIDFAEGLHILKLLTSSYPDGINTTDRCDDTPIDLVQVARMGEDPNSEEYERLTNIYRVLRSISILVYRQQKLKWEADGFDSSKSISDQKSISTATTNTGTSCQLSVAISDTNALKNFNTNLDTNMDVQESEVPPIQRQFSKVSISSSSKSVTKKGKGMSLRFWKR